MASVEKFSAGAVRNQLRHNRREIEHSSNLDIDPSRQGQDYVLSPDRGMTEYDYFKQRISQLYVYNRNDIKVMAGWVVTAPQNLDPKRYDDFFCSTYDFLENRYGKENVIQAIVHDDEGGQPHLHFCFVPVVEDPKHDEGYKVCANEVLDRRELRNFHPALQRYLDEHGLEDAHIMTGVTKQQGGNRTVAQLKAEREQEIKRPSLYFGEATNMQHLHFLGAPLINLFCALIVICMEHLPSHWHFYCCSFTYAGRATIFRIPSTVKILYISQLYRRTEFFSESDSTCLPTRQNKTKGTSLSSVLLEQARPVLC